MSHRHAFRGAGGAGGENDPRIVFRCWHPSHTPVAGTLENQAGRIRHRGDLGLFKNQVCALVWIIGIHRNISRPGCERGQNRHIELRGSAGKADTNAIATADAAALKISCQLGDLL